MRYTVALYCLDTGDSDLYRCDADSPTDAANRARDYHAEGGDIHIIAVFEGEPLDVMPIEGK